MKSRIFGSVWSLGIYSENVSKLRRLIEVVSEFDCSAAPWARESDRVNQGALPRISLPLWKPVIFTYLTISCFKAKHQYFTCRQPNIGFAATGCTCSDGTPGYDSRAGDVCCPTACGDCGGRRCRRHGGGPRAGLGREFCCSRGILESGNVCGVNGQAAPCIIH